MQQENNKKLLSILKIKPLCLPMPMESIFIRRAVTPYLRVSEWTNDTSTRSQVTRGAS